MSSAIWSRKTLSGNRVSTPRVDASRNGKSHFVYKYTLQALAFLTAINIATFRIKVIMFDIVVCFQDL